MQIKEVLKKLAICNHYVKKTSFGVSKTHFYKVKSFILYNILKYNKDAMDMSITIYRQERGDEKFWSITINFEDITYEFHQNQKSISYEIVKHYIMDDTIFEFSPSTEEYDDYSIPELKKFCAELVQYSIDIVPYVKYIIIKLDDVYSLYTNKQLVFRADKFSKLINKIYHKNPINDSNFIVTYNNQTVLQRIAGLSEKNY